MVLAQPVSYKTFRIVEDPEYLNGKLAIREPACQ